MQTRFPLRCRFAASLLLGVATLVGCAHKDSLVGKWQGSMAQQTGSVNGTYEFTPDGKETITIQPNGPSSGSIVVNETYTVSGSSLTQTMTGLTMGNKPIPIQAKQAQPKTLQYTIAGNQLTMTDSKMGKTITLTRVN